AAGTTRQVTFQVVIDDVDGEPGETVVADIFNTGAVQSGRTPLVRSNEVVTPVSKVLPVKVSQPPKVLPVTGTSVNPAQIVGAAVILLALGLLFVAASHRRRGAHRS
ncbi:MAG TPA: LPXTG cell wall anchor domain-containing protein, partial [Actinomycetes bacterium]